MPIVSSQCAIGLSIPAEKRIPLQARRSNGIGPFRVGMSLFASVQMRDSGLIHLLLLKLRELSFEGRTISIPPSDKAIKLPRSR